MCQERRTIAVPADTDGHEPTSAPPLLLLEAVPDHHAKVKADSPASLAEDDLHRVGLAELCAAAGAALLSWRLLQESFRHRGTTRLRPEANRALIRSAKRGLQYVVLGCLRLARRERLELPTF